MTALVLILLFCSWIDFSHGQDHAHPRYGLHHRGRFFSTPSFDYEDFNRYDNITRELMRLHKVYPHMVNMIEIGRTHENRSINVVKISGDLRVKNKVAMWIDAGIHAQQWVAVSTALIFIRELVTSYDHDLVIHNLLNQVDFYILPVTNPDGYEYTHTEDRCWRKNRRPTRCTFDGYNSTCCAGVDLNRNYDWYFGTTNTGPPCAKIYPGPFPGSEPETGAIMQFLANHPVQAVVSMHTCGRAIAIPFAHLNNTFSPNYEQEKELAQKAANALYGEYGTTLEIGQAGELGYEISGTSTDWIKAKLHVPYVYTFGLRYACSDLYKNTASCEKDFTLPKADIRPIGLETFEAIKVIAAEITNVPIIIE